MANSFSAWSILGGLSLGLVGCGPNTWGSSPDFGSQWRRLPEKKETNVPAAWIYDTNNLYIPDFATKFAPNGFLRLEFDGPRLVEFVRAPDNANVWLKELT